MAWAAGTTREKQSEEEAGKCQVAPEKKKSTCELLMSAHVTGVWSSCDPGKSQRNILMLLLPQADAS